MDEGDGDGDGAASEELDGFKDFTVSSSWERFIAAVESVCLDWQNAGKDALLNAGAKRVEDSRDLYCVHAEVSQGHKNYRLEFFFGKALIGRHGAEDWQSGLHHLQLWFGVKDFIVITPVSLSGVLLDAPEATMLLSTVSIALANCGSSWPVFVPVHDPTRKSYMGIESLEGLSSIKFEADRIGSQVPIKLLHLEGLYDLFTSKLGAASRTAEDAPRFGFTMRLTYTTSRYLFDRIPPGVDRGDEQENEMADASLWDDNFPWAEWHSVEDPIKGFELIAIWRNRYILNSFEMAESENASTFDADNWMLKPLLTRHDHGDEASGFTARLRRLVDAFVLSKEAQFMEDFVTELEKSTQSCKIPPTTVLDRVLKDIFFQAPKASGLDNEVARMIKAAPPDSLFGRFCLHVLWFGDCNIRAIAQLWVEFLREVTWCWEERQLLPRSLPDELPDYSTCLSQQKLQMLARCIKLRKNIDEREGTSAKEDDDADIPSSSKKFKLSSKGDNVMENDLAYNDRKGSAGPFNNLLLSRSNRPLHAPLTQTPPIMTEDMLQEREHALATLENSPSGKAARIRLQSDILASDMAAFKAANPGSVLEDFVRWHSPRDWIEEDTSDARPSGRLSRRMAEPGNAWEQIWGSAEPIPASEQKPLFDFTREGEKVLHHLETLKPHQLVAQVVSTAFVCAADILWRTPGCKLQPVLELFDEFFAVMAAVLAPLGSISIQDKEAKQRMEEWERNLNQLCSAFGKLEDAVAEAASLRQKLPDASESFLSSIFRCTQGESWSVAPLQAYRDREMVAETLFSSQSVSETWEESLRMGNFLNGHEPLYREVLFTCYEEEAVYGGGGDGGGGGKTKKSVNSMQRRGYSHRMFSRGTADDLQISLSSTSRD